MCEYFECTPGPTFDPAALFRDCIESGADALLMDQEALPASFFDLSSGHAGELLHRLSVYQMRLAVVVPDLTVHSESFQAFAREANRGLQFRFVPSRREAIEWLSS